MFKTTKQGDMPYVPTLEEAVPELKKARSDLKALIEKTDKMRAEYSEGRRQYETMPALPGMITAEGLVRSTPDPVEAAAWQVKREARANTVNEKRAEYEGLKPVVEYQTEVMHGLQNQAQAKIAEQLKPYYAALVREYALGHIEANAEQWIAAEKLRQLHAEILAQDITPASWSAFFFQLHFREWAFDRAGTAVATVQEAGKEVDRLVADDILTAEDIKAISPELAKVWGIKG
jgi:hypothetical protein